MHKMVWLVVAEENRESSVGLTAKDHSCPLDRTVCKHCRSIYSVKTRDLAIPSFYKEYSVMSRKNIEDIN